MSSTRRDPTFSPAAEDDLEEIAVYLIISSGIELARSFGKVCQSDGWASCRITLHGVALPFELPSTRLIRRFLVYHPFDRWLVFYTPSTFEDGIRVERVLHSARDWRPLFL